MGCNTSGQHSRVYRDPIKLDFLDFARSNEALELAFKLIPTSEAYRLKANALIKLSDYDGARNAVSLSILLDPSNDRAYYDRAVWVGGSQRSDLHDLTMATKFKPDNPDYHYELGMTRADSPESIDDFSRVIELDPNNLHAYFWRGSARLEMRQFDGAISDLSQFIDNKTDGDLGLAFELRAEARTQARDYNGAISDLRRAIEEGAIGIPGNLFLKRAKLLLAVGDIRQACFDVQRAMGTSEGRLIYYNYCRRW